MKTILLFLAIPGFLGLGCVSSQTNEQHRIVKVEFNYLPWSVHRESTITEYELLDLEDPLISTYCSTDKDFIFQLTKLFNVSELKIESSIQAIEPYMAIYLYFDNGKKNKIFIGQSMFLELNETIYSMSGEQRKWLRESIPQATIPNGRRKQCE